MAYKCGDRHQLTLLPTSIEEYISPEDPVRAYDAFIAALKLEEIGIRVESNQVGNPCYEPKSMLKLLIYGCSYGWRSSRKLERAVHHNLSFIWLMGGLKPDHKTIAEFRRNYKTTLMRVLKSCAHFCIKAGLIEGNTLFVDGSKIRANASLNNSWTKEKCTKTLAKIDKRIEEILNECEKRDCEESEQNSMIKMPPALKGQNSLKAKVQSILKELESESKERINSTDSDCVRIHSRQGNHAGFNAQIVVDEKHGLIVESNVVNENNDLNQFAEQINQANETLGKNCTQAVADAGYANYNELEKIDQKGIKVMVPARSQTNKEKAKPFAKENFPYDSEQDQYVCPAKQVLTFARINRKKQARVYTPKSTKICGSCENYGSCTKAKRGRIIYRYFNEGVREKLMKQYAEPESIKIYALRKQKVELPFGHIKRNLGVNSFLLRGLAGVKAEMALYASCFNITRIINIMGISKMIDSLKPKVCLA